MNSKSAKKTCLLIAGMHRSGTSALTRVLSLLGADLPKTLMGSNESNETGHWESIEFMKLNEEILNSAGSSWNDWTQCTPGWFESNKSEEFIENAKTVFYDEFGTSRLMLMKDPRNCRILPFWLKVLDDDNIETKIILPIRNPVEVAASHQKRDGIHKHYGMLLWLRHVLDAEFFSRGRPRLFSTYNQLIGNWSGVVDRIESQLGIIWPRRSAKIIEEIENYVSPQYRHHENSDVNLQNNSNIPAAIRDTYAIMLRWSENGEDQKDFTVLDQIRKDFDNSAPMFAILVDRAALADYEIANLTNQINGLNQHIISLAQANQEHEHTIHTLNSTIKQKDAEIEDRINNLEVIAQERKLLEGEVDNLSQLLLKANNNIENLKNEHEGLQKLITHERNDKKELQNRISNISTHLENSEKGKQEIIKRLIVVQKNLDDAQAAEEIAINAKLNLIEQITHEERPYFSLKRSSTKRKANLLRNAGIVDEEWYLKEYPDIAATGMNPTLHWVKHGKKEGRKPRG